MGEPWAMIVLFIYFYYYFFGGGVGGVLGVLSGVGFFFWKTTTGAQIIVLGRFGSPEKGL